MRAQPADRNNVGFSYFKVTLKNNTVNLMVDFVRAFGNLQIRLIEIVAMSLNTFHDAWVVFENEYQSPCIACPKARSEYHDA